MNIFFRQYYSILQNLCRKLSDFPVRERERWVLWLPVFLGLGIAIYFKLPDEPPIWLGGVSLLLCLFLWKTGQRYQRYKAVAAIVAFMAVTVGFTTAQWRTVLVSAPVMKRTIGPTTVEGRIAGVERRSRGPRLTVENLRIAGLSPQATPERVRVGLQGNQPELVAGDWVRMTARIGPPPPPSAPGSFDFQRLAYFKSLGGTGFAYGRAMVTGKREEMTPGHLNALLVPSYALSRLRQTIAERVGSAFEDMRKQDTGAVAIALMNGDRGSINDETMEAFRNSGVAHLLAISGLHIGLVAGFIYFTVRAGLALIPGLALSLQIKKWAAIFGLLGALFYALVAGATVPTLRAFLMVGLVLSAVILDRRGLSMRIVAFAAAVILLIQPESLLGASFQLSFAAVVALVAVYETISNRQKEKEARTWLSRFFHYFAGVALTTLVAGMATAPFAVFHFNRIADYGLVANMLAVPVTALWIMPWALVSFVLMPFGLEKLALYPMGEGLDAVIFVAHKVAAWPGAVTLLPVMPDWGLGLTVTGGLWLCLWRQRWRYLGVAGVVAGFISPNWTDTPHVLIDGQGKLMAVQKADGRLAISSKITGRFTREIWLRRVAQETPVEWPRGDLSVHGQDLSCDSLGCIYHSSGRIMALVKNEGALDEDCRRVDILISAVPIRRKCTGPELVIDRFDMWRNGGYALWLNKDGVRVANVNDTRGNRPWVLRPEK